MLKRSLNVNHKIWKLYHFTITGSDRALHGTKAKPLWR